MVRNYKKKTNRGEWDEAAMRNAVEDVLQNKKGYKLASKCYGVPQTTLERKVKLSRQNENRVCKIKVPLGPISTVFTEEEEQELAVYLKDMESRLFGLTTSDLQKLAYQLAIANNKQHKFSGVKEQTGKDWVKGFLNRHPELSLRKPENTSAARASGFNRVSVGKFFELLGKTLDEYKFTADKIYNCDETGVSIVPKSRSKIIATAGKKQVGALTSAERGTTVTVEVCFNAAGTYLPPMFIYPRKRMKRELLFGAPPNAWAECSDSGWMTTEIFFSWFKKFIEFTKASKDNRVLLLFDGHVTHTQNIRLIDEARDHGVVIICFPPHTTHKLQPADVGFMRPLSTYYDQAITAWLRSHPGQVMTQFQIAELFGEAFIRSATMSTALNAFKATGIWPYNHQIFTDVDFVAAEATEIDLEPASLTSQVTTPPCVPMPLESLDSPLNTTSDQATNLYIQQFRDLPNSFDVNIAPTPFNLPISSPSRSNINIFSDQPSTSFALEPQSQSSASQINVPSQSQTSALNQQSTTSLQPQEQPEPSTSFHLASPRLLMPIPRTNQKRKRQVRKRGKTAIITSSPFKKELQEKLNDKLMATAKKRKESCDKAKKKNTNKKTKKHNKESDSETEDAKCLYCQGLYSESREGWITCQECGRWAHCGCAGVDDDDEDAVHTCPFCEDSDD